MAVDFDNVVFGAGQSTTGLFALGNYTGTNLVSGLTSVTVDGEVIQAGSQVQLTLNVGNTVQPVINGTYLGFQQGSTPENVTYFFQGEVAGISGPVTIGVNSSGQVPAIGVLTPVNTTPGVSPPTSANVPCYAEGTLIRTTRGDVPVEELVVGDIAVTASGGTRPITWLGNRRVTTARHADQHMVQPIRIRAGAIAPNMPARDLCVSPEHALFLDDVFVQARFLLNDVTIVQEAVEAVTYWHVELDGHDVLLAENAPAESYLDVGNRSGLLGRDNVVALHPLPAPNPHGHCAPQVIDGERLVAIRAWLGERARHVALAAAEAPALRKAG